MENKKQKSENEELEINSFIKKISIELYIASKKLENFSTENKKEALEISKKLNKIDKELLKRFDIKLSSSTKESALELINIMK
jgi:hypothetical protein